MFRLNLFLLLASVTCFSHFTIFNHNKSIRERRAILNHVNTYNNITLRNTDDYNTDMIASIILGASMF